MKYSHVFVEAKREGYPLSIFDESEIEFIKSKNLIDIRGTQFLPLFVGEFITPENSYFSLPKNFEPTQDNIELFKKVLSRYKDLKGEDGKTLLSNYTFTSSDKGTIKSEKFYYNELKEFFLDYITYEYIYPKKMVKKHSTGPISGGKLDVLSTMRNRPQKGPGITYKVKDVKNTEDWNIDDIYYTTIISLLNKYGTEDDKIQIDEMTQFLREEGYILNIVDVSNVDKVINDIHKCDVGIIHQPIKNTLLDYYESTKIGEKYSINAFYTIAFQYVWEELSRECLKHDKQFEKSMNSIFNRPEMRRKWFPNEDEVEKFKSENRIKETSREKVGNGIRLEYEVRSISKPDIFSNYKNKKIIGDAKYYKDPENSEYEKEFRTYNTLMDNKYPMVVFVPSKITRVLHVRQEGELELVIFSISVEKAISDAINDTNQTINKVHTLLYDKGYTKRT